MAQYFIGVDSGTQGTKAVLMDGASGKIKASASAAYGLLTGLPMGAKEQHPKTWVSAMEKTIQEVMAQSRVKPNEVKGIGISGQQHGFVPLDEQGQVIRPAKLWCDTSTVDEAESLVNRLGGLAALIQLTGNGMPPGFTAPKILWLKQREPKNYGRLRTVLLPHDYLNYVLTGNLRMEAGDASGTGLFNTRTRNWEPRCVEVIDPALADKLPPIDGSSSQICGTLLPAVAKKLGLDTSTIVSAGGGDNMMGAIGTGNTKAGILTVSLGTSGTIYAYSPRPVIDPQGEVAAFCDSTGGWLPLICTMNVTVATELVKKAFNWDNEQLTREASKVSAGSDGLLLLPYFEGERTPNLPQARAVYAGFHSGNFTRGHMARAAMEGVALGLNYGLNRLKDLGIRPKQIRLTGGGSKNPVWRQILADVFDAEVVGLSTAEGAAMGAAIQAKWSFMLHQGERIRVQQITDALVKVDPSTRCQPRKVEVKRYRQLQEIHNQLSRACAPVLASLTRMA